MQRLPNNIQIYFVGAIERHPDDRAQGGRPDGRGIAVHGQRGGLRLQDRIHHRSRHHGPPRTGRRRHRSLLLAHGLQASPVMSLSILITIIVL